MDDASEGVTETSAIKDVAGREDRRGPPLGVGIQAAVISARKAGYTEKSLNKQGNLFMSDLDPV